MVHHPRDLDARVARPAGDRRTIFMIAVLPMLLYPLAGFGLLQLAAGLGQKPQVVGVYGARTCDPPSPRQSRPARGLSDALLVGRSPGPCRAIRRGLCHGPGRQNATRGLSALFKRATSSFSIPSGNPDDRGLLRSRRRARRPHAASIAGRRPHSRSTTTSSQVDRRLARVDLRLVVPANFRGRLRGGRPIGRALRARPAKGTIARGWGLACRWSSAMEEAAQGHTFAACGTTGGLR